MLETVSSDADYVLVLHGLARSSRAMTKMSRALKKAGYTVVNVGYPSTRLSVEQLADHVQTLIPTGDSHRAIHFIGHSLGAIIIRCLIARHRPKRLGRVVMLGPPNRGSSLADFFKRFYWYRRWLGPAAQQLGTDSEAIAKRLPAIDYEVGVIAGARRINFLFSRFILGGKNDGTLSVEETYLPGLKDFLILPVTHTFMSANRTVIDQTLHFLKQGYFKK